jgi:hypothetical protein
MSQSIVTRKISRRSESCTGASLLRPSLPGRQRERGLVFLPSARNDSMEARFTSAFSSITLFS